jgi:putative transcriptional regulator
MQDPRFSETVIILLRYGWQGAVGLIINRPTKVGITKALPGVSEQHVEPVYFGGPVGMHEMRMLFKSASQPGDASHVFEDVYLSRLCRLCGMGGPAARQGGIEGRLACHGR